MGLNFFQYCFQIKTPSNSYRPSVFSPRRLKNANPPVGVAVVRTIANSPPFVPGAACAGTSSSYGFIASYLLRAAAVL